MSATILNTTSLAATDASIAPVASSSAARWTSRILFGITLLFLTWDGVIKLLGAKEAIEGSIQLGFKPHQLIVIGLVELACIILYAIPRTAPIGAILLTGYFGGAICTHLRVENPLFSHTLFPVYIAAMIWTALYLRDVRIRNLVRSAR